MNVKEKGQRVLQSVKEKGEQAIDIVCDNKWKISTVCLGVAFLGYSAAGYIYPGRVIKNLARTSITDPKTGLMWRTCKPITHEHLLQMTKGLNEGLDFPTVLKQVGLIK